MKDRIINNPFTSIIGILLIGLSIYILKMDLDTTIKLSMSILFGGAGLVALGLKDKID